MKKKIYKVLSILLAVAVVLSCCVMAFTASAGTGTAAAATYYLSANGSNDNDGSQAAPFKTLGGAITKAVEAATAGGYNTADSTVYFKLLGTDAVDYSDANGIDFDFTLNISSATSGGVLGKISQSATTFCGPIVLENLAFNVFEWDEIYLDGNDLTIGDDVSLGFRANFLFHLGGSNKITSSPYTKAQNIKFVNSVGGGCKYYIIGGNSNSVYESDLNLTYDAPKYSQEIRFGTSNRNATTTYNGNVNLNFVASAGVTIVKANNVKFGSNAAVQIINSTNNTVDYSNMAEFFPTSTYVIQNTSGDKEIISYTETVGKFKVNANGKKVEVKSKSGTPVDVVDGYVTLPAPGEYEVSVVREPVYKKYYVSSQGISINRGERPATAGTEENPVRTFTDVTFLLEQDGLTAIDVAQVYFKSGEKISWNRESEADPSDVDALVYPVKHTCKVEVDSTDPSTKAQIASYYSICFYGDTVVKNVSMTVEYRYANMALNNNNVTFEEGSEINTPELYLYDKSISKYSNDLNTVIKGKFICSKITLGASYYSQTVSGDLNFYIDNPEAQASFVFGGGRSSTEPNVYDGNINIVIKNAKSAGLGIGTTGATFNGALQVMIDSSLDLPYSLKQNFNDVQVAGGKWLITNDAEDDDFVSFTSEKGKLSVKDGATAYSRQYKKDLVTHTGGTIDLSSAPGAYTVSDKELDEITDDSHKMMYFYTAGNVHKIMSQTYLVAGETYIFEYKMYCNNFNDLKLLMGHPNTDGSQTEDFKIVEKELVGNYYKVKAELNVPKSYDKHFAHIGWTMPSYSEGVIFDRKFYRKGDASKTDLTVENQKFLDGLDGIKFDGSFWGNIFTGTKGGKGVTYWTDGIQQLRVMNVDTKFIDELIRLANPDDGDWWNEEDIVEDGVVSVYGQANGIFKDSDGNPVEGVKFELVSDENTYTAISDAKGEFDFGKVLIGFYDLYLIDGSKKISTGVSAFFEEADVVTFKLESDISELKQEAIIEDTPAQDENIDSDITDSEVTDSETEDDEVVVSGNLSGTVYTPYLDTVSNLKVYLRDVGEVVTDENGKFAFANLPVGEYELYTVLADNSEYSFRKVTIGANQDVSVKLKYDPAVTTDGDQADNGWIIWVIIASGVALLVVAGVICLVVFKKKKSA